MTKEVNAFNMLHAKMKGAVTKQPLNLNKLLVDFI